MQFIFPFGCPLVTRGLYVIFHIRFDWHQQMRWVEPTPKMHRVVFEKGRTATKEWADDEPEVASDISMWTIAAKGRVN